MELPAGTVGGLLPNVSLSKNGLYPSEKFQFIPTKYNIDAGKALKIINHNAMGKWSSDFIEINCGRGNGTLVGKVLITISSNNDTIKGISAIKVGNTEDLEVYKDGEYVYVKNTYMYNVNVTIQATDVYHIEADGNIDLPSDAVKVEYV